MMAHVCQKCEVGQSLHELIVEGGLERENVVILGVHKIGKTCLGTVPDFNQILLDFYPTPVLSSPRQKKGSFN